MTKDDIRRNQINHYLDRIQLMKKNNTFHLYDKAFAYYEKKIAELIKEMVEEE